jgi:peptidoglycan-associated lipoprotein
MTTQSAIIRRLAIGVAFAAIISISACKTAKKTEEEAAGPVVEETVLGDSDSGKAMGLQTIYFPYDSFTLAEEAKSALKANAQILKDKASAKIQIEGHCDKRGGIQYNIALGEKRANAVKSFITDLGIAADRITTISFGKERLLIPGDKEEAHAKNRRANFVITSR